MGTWDVEPFDNDDAADFADDLDDVPESERPEMIRAALVAAIDNDGYLDYDEGAHAVAAAALVAAGVPGNEGLSPRHHGPKQPIPALPKDFVDLAIRAVDRVMADKSELRELWEEGSGGEGPWHSSMHRLRAALADPEGRIAVFEVGR
ncbi:DUF4259 domain-containing protein [Actinospica robiniae]|uniref:DUF4259 domain-containing protein n=1 Tax=Actinospica robiniae TaxID=304901 RepID=UPI0004178DBC|nr:DUF4259 domain-containing protein [Actinospica robiniae]